MIYVYNPLLLTPQLTDRNKNTTKGNVHLIIQKTCLPLGRGLCSTLVIDNVWVGCIFVDSYREFSLLAEQVRCGSALHLSVVLAVQPL